MQITWSFYSKLLKHYCEHDWKNLIETILQVPNNSIWKYKKAEILSVYRFVKSQLVKYEEKEGIIREAENE